MSERQAKAPTMSALLPSRLVPEDMLSEWQGPNLPNTKNYAPSEDSIGGMIRNALLSGVAGVGGFTGLPMSDEGNRAALLGELLAAGMPLVGGVKTLRGVAGAKKLPYKAARESLRDVADANFDYGIPVGNRTVNIDTLRGGMSAAADDAAKVNKIAQQMSSKDGYIERLIVDQNGNVIEGQHRLRALQSLGVQDVPVSVIQDYSDVVETLQKQGMRPEHARQVTQQTHDMLKDSGSAAKVRSDYNLSGQYEAQFESALDLMDAPKAKQGIKAFHGTTDQALRVPDPQMAVEVPGAAFFSSNRDVADQYQWPREYGEIIDGPRGRVIEANLDLQNPMTVDFGGDFGDAIRLEKLVREAKGKGHDALVVHNVDDSVDSSRILGTTYAVFNKEQIQFVKKYGIAGALSAGAINELEARQLQAQGYQ